MNVSVIMSAYNSESYLNESIESILKQSFDNYEYIIVNDGSTDNSRKIMESYKDKRIKILNNKNNMGLTVSLNKAIKLAKGEYIIRMDADDVSLPLRIEKQVKYMDIHPEVGICGSWVKTIGRYPSKIWKYSSDRNYLKASLIYKSPLAHPSVVMRRKYMIENNLSYNPYYKSAQDYDLWTRCVDYFEISNIEEVLLLFRRHANAIGIIKEQQRKIFTDEIRTKQLNKLKDNTNNYEIQLHNKIASISLEKEKYNDTNEACVFLDEVILWLESLDKVNKTRGLYDNTVFRKVLGEMWFETCYCLSFIGMISYKKYKSSYLHKSAKIRKVKDLYFLLKSIKTIS